MEWMLRRPLTYRSKMHFRHAAIFARLFTPRPFAGNPAVETYPFPNLQTADPVQRVPPSVRIPALLVSSFCATLCPLEAYGLSHRPD
ncbi:uncharacterized protein EI90DRAFT_1007708 [Cantharellus anzutake]|uniref:uncharacterized protein n=1 Tax=Cantharellus anzutake TaxID=1750568 RepID=UPI001903F0F8|nr:uncharacterized protein EI90DRAFT_1007708 [Cantharellus anzutake]KAF8331319.1 hypothetical protein EI90DRAFT_1007708 [Cantharellus anzutake]